MWSFNSRKELIANCVVLLSLILLIEFDLLRPPQEATESEDYNEDNYFRLNRPVTETLEQAVESLEFLYESQRGTAEVASVVEKPKEVEEVARCSCSESKVEEGSAVEQDQRIFRINWTRTDGGWYLFSAYLDKRHNSLFPELESVQVIASAFGTSLLNRTHLCHLHFSSASTAVVVRAHVRWVWQRAWDPRNEFYNAFLITCPVPRGVNSEGISSVGISSSREECGAKMARLQVYRPKSSDMLKRTAKEWPREHKELKIGVCVKGLAFMDTSPASSSYSDGQLRKMVEWLELQYALGADSVTVYVYFVPTKLRELLEFYARNAKRKFYLIELDLPGNSPNQPFVRHEFIWRNRQQKRRHELIPYNDCFYRYSHTHHFVLIVDTDEVVVPLRHDSWREMLGELLRRDSTDQQHFEPSSISVRNVFKLTAEDDGQSLFDNPYRSGQVQDREQSGKSFINTRSIATVFNHFALHRLHAKVARTVYLDMDVALKLHFKARCPVAELGQRVCDAIATNRIRDESLDRVKGRVIAAVDELIANWRSTQK